MMRVWVSRSRSANLLAAQADCSASVLAPARADHGQFQLDVERCFHRTDLVCQRQRRHQPPRVGLADAVIGANVVQEPHLVVYQLMRVSDGQPLAVKHIRLGKVAQPGAAAQRVQRVAGHFRLTAGLRRQQRPLRERPRHRHPLRGG